jgi:hypothetical protein
MQAVLVMVSPPDLVEAADQAVLVGLLQAVAEVAAALALHYQ